jgi:hypothetical protein
MDEKEGFYMRGQLVIARAFQGGLLVRRVWEAANGLVYLATDAEYRKLEAGLEALPPIGFPANDVFVYDKAVATAKAKPQWDKLKAWKPYQVVSG